MNKRELQKRLLQFIEEIKTCMSQDEAVNIRKRIEEFYDANDIPEEDDVLAQSGFCELLAMLAGVPYIDAMTA